MRSCLFFLGLLALTGPAVAQSFLPDPLFGNAGMVVTPETDKTSVIYDVALQQDGKIVAAGMIYDNDGPMKYHTYLIRYNTNGTIDNSFGVNGKVKTEVGTEDMAYALAIQADEKIVVVGNETIIVAIDSTSASITSKPFLVRYNSSGTLDSAFGTDGIHHLGMLNPYSKKYLSAIAIRPNGAIVTGGAVLYGQFNQMLLVSLNPDGTYNNSFGTNGIARVEIETGKDATLYDLALQPDGKLIIAGSSGAASLVAPPNTKVALARLLTNGLPDPAFGNAGKVVTPISTSGASLDIANSIDLQADGKIVAAGGSDKYLTLLRYQANGMLDATFGTGGIMVNTALAPAQNVHIDQNGKLLTSSLVAQQDPYRTDIMLARHGINGAPDLSFGTSGTLTIDKSEKDNAYAMIAQPDHKIILGGHTIDAASQNTSFTLFRFKDNSGGTSLDDAGLSGYQVQLYPNPATEAINLLFDQQPKAAFNIRIIDATGRVCYDNSTKKALTTISTKSLASGFYLLQIASGKETKTFRFDVQK